MVREPAPNIQVSALQWDDENEEHLLRHNLTISTVEEVRAAAPRYFLNLEDRSGTHVMIGPDSEGGFYYVVLAPTAEATTWRPVTGWRMDRTRARRLYDSHG